MFPKFTFQESQHDMRENPGCEVRESDTIDDPAEHSTEEVLSPQPQSQVGINATFILSNLTFYLLKPAKI